MSHSAPLPTFPWRVRTRTEELRAIARAPGFVGVQLGWWE